jgi:hypothetical protein
MRSLAALSHRERTVVAFTVAFTVLFTVIGLARHEAFLWVYLPALAASVAIVAWIDGRWGPIPSIQLWMLSVWAGLHLAGGLAANPTGRTDILYGMWLIDGVLRWDQMVHGFGIWAATLTLITAARGSERPLLWGFVIGQGVGLVNETMENVFAAFVDNSNVGDAVNTAWDLGWHLIGGSAAVLWVAAKGVPGLRDYRRTA